MLLLAGPAAADRARTRRAAGRAVGGSAAGVEQALLPRPAAALWGPAAACAAHITFSRSQISSLTYCRPTRKLVHTLATSSRGLEMAADADLLGIGTHCDLEGCGQLDFLPFNCDCCRKTFCLVRHGGLWMPGSRPAHQGHPEPLYVKPATLSARRAAGRQQRRAAARFAWVALLARALRCARCFRRLRCACCAPAPRGPASSYHHSRRLTHSRVSASNCDVKVADGNGDEHPRAARRGACSRCHLHPSQHLIPSQHACAACMQPVPPPPNTHAILTHTGPPLLCSARLPDRPR